MPTLASVLRLPERAYNTLACNGATGTVY